VQQIENILAYERRVFNSSKGQVTVEELKEWAEKHKEETGRHC